MNSAEDFMLLLVCYHVIAASHLLMQNKPPNVTILAQEVIEKFVHLSNVSQRGETPESNDMVQLYMPHNFCHWDFCGMGSMMPPL